MLKKTRKALRKSLNKNKVKVRPKERFEKIDKLREAFGI